MRAHLVWNEAHPDDLVQPGERVWHLNGIPDDDRLENLDKRRPLESPRYVRPGRLYPTSLADGRIARAHLVWNEAHPDDLVQPGERVYHLNRRTGDDRHENLYKRRRRITRLS